MNKYQLRIATPDGNAYSGEAEMLAPMQSRFAHLEIGIVDGKEEIAALEAQIAARR